jgi:hypothetical protein
MTYYSFVTEISTDIKNKIKAQNDIEKLYYHLSDILVNLRDADNQLKTIFIMEKKIKNNNTTKGWAEWAVMEMFEEEDDDDINEMTKEVDAYINEMTEEEPDCINEMIKFQPEPVS